MNLTNHLSWCATLVLIVALCGMGKTAFSADAPKKKPVYSTNSQDRVDCERRLNLIYGAIQGYRKHHQKLPQWLSELTPEFINDPNTLICPFVEKTGNLSDWRRWTVTVSVFGDPGNCSYAYEFCTKPFQAVPGWTTRDYKQLQMQLIGFGVPIVRCFAHVPYLNLGFDGTIYPSAGEWEDDFVTGPRQKAVLHDVLLLMTNSLNQRTIKLIEPRDPQASSRLLDLTSYYNASLFHLSQIDYSGKLLASHPQGIQTIGGVQYDIRGLVHLAGTNFPIIFPTVASNILVKQKCSALHFLHGAQFEAPSGAKVARYIIRYAGGDTDEVSLAYGRDLKTRWFDDGQKSELDNPKVAWVSPPDKVGTTGRSLRLYQTTWRNKYPDKQLEAVDFVSHLTDSAPFLVAITVE